MNKSFVICWLLKIKGKKKQKRKIKDPLDVTLTDLTVCENKYFNFFGCWGKIFFLRKANGSGLGGTDVKG